MRNSQVYAILVVLVFLAGLGTLSIVLNQNHVEEILGMTDYFTNDTHLTFNVVDVVELEAVSKIAAETASTNKIRVLIVLGTRPEIIKFFPLVKHLKESPEYETFVIHSGQHLNLSRPLFDLFRIKPDLHIKPPVDSNLNHLLANVHIGMQLAIAATKAHLVLVQGDTATASSAATAAFLEGIPVGHVEAGLRSFRLDKPFPEEFARRNIDSMARLCFAPTPLNSANLLNDGVDASRVFVVGNTVVDSLLYILQTKPSQEAKAVIDSAFASHKSYTRTVLVTMHRRESWGEPMKALCGTIAKLAASHREDTLFVFPIHPNPTVQSIVHSSLDGIENVNLLPPFSYEPFIHVLRKIDMILTDSGGIQEEATALGIPVLVMRDTTERMEGVASGVSKLVGVEPNRVYEFANELLSNAEAYAAMAHKSDTYGIGNSAELISRVFLKFKGEILNRFSAPASSTASSIPIPVVTAANRGAPEQVGNPVPFGSAFDKHRRERKVDDIAVIVTVYKREYTMEQIAAIKAQEGVTLSSIWIWQNGNFVDLSDVKKEHSDVHVISSDFNFKFHGRFALPLLLDSKYVAIFDDDLIPGIHWLRNALRCVKSHGGSICGANGRIVRNIDPGTEYDDTFYGDEEVLKRGIADHDVEVDFVGHCWIFPTTLAHALWEEPVPTWDNAEDVSFAAAAQMHVGVGSYVVRKPVDDESEWPELEGHGSDSHATSLIEPSHGDLRMAVQQWWIDRGWATILRRNGEIAIK